MDGIKGGIVDIACHTALSTSKLLHAISGALPTIQPKETGFETEDECKLACEKIAAVFVSQLTYNG